jgi:hypothetical protein
LPIYSLGDLSHTKRYRERGWAEDEYVIKQMKEKGMDNTAMLNEIIDIEIEVIKRTMGGDAW